MIALLPLWPLLGFLLLAFAGARLPRRVVAGVGCGSVALSALTAAVLALGHPAGRTTTLPLWTWFTVGEGAVARIALHYDALALVMSLVVTGVGLLIHLYSAWYMADDPDQPRFFAYLNLFVAAMLLLVLADDLALLLLGWEGVGLCSYLLIGFWYEDPANGRAARKAFLVTRTGDVALLVGVFLLVTRLGTLRIAEAIERASAQWAVGDPVAIAAAALLLGGAVGKSAQWPLQTWLPDAMAGPTPVSALIHAATMVTAGVYLIARAHPLFALAPPVLAATALIGAVTLLLAGGAALFQRDIKRVLAWSTISQLGYMFLALGVGAWSAAVFHLMTHAFFKALLFLAAGAIIQALHGEHDLTAMGGLRRRLPWAWAATVVGGAALAGVPLITAGFFSKDLILHEAFVTADGVPWLWMAGLLGVALTAAYTLRLILLAFHGPQQREVAPQRNGLLRLPLAVLTLLSIAGGWVWWPGNLGGAHPFASLLEPVLGGPAHQGGAGLETGLQAAAVAASLLGGAVAWGRWRAGRRAEGTLAAWGARGWGLDALQEALLVRPYAALARLLADDPVDAGFRGLAVVVGGWNTLLARGQNGRLRWYATVAAVGLVLALAGVLWR